MQTVKENKEIGKYLRELINKKFDSQRQFCIRYLEESYGREPDNTEIGNMANRVSQIIKGEKAVQLGDLPIFTKLLEVSCEEILSAGEDFAATKNHLTHYAVACSKDKAVWEEYAGREDKTILNSDEYGKTVIDYALEFKNYEFLKYLMEEKYIWFVDNSKENFFGHFRVDTNITKIKTTNLNTSLYENDNLRIKMISLAIEHGEIEMLKMLRAREIPSLYQPCYFACSSIKYDEYYNQEMIQHIAESDEKVLEYFSEEFEIEDRNRKITRFLFPYMTNLLDLLIKNDSPYAEKLLRASIEHSQDTCRRLEELRKNAFDSYMELYKEYYKAHCINEMFYDEKEAEETFRPKILKTISEELKFDDNGGIVSYWETKTMDGMMTNVIRVNVSSDKSEIASLIQELNALYDKIRLKQFD